MIVISNFFTFFTFFSLLDVGQRFLLKRTAREKFMKHTFRGIEISNVQCVKSTLSKIKCLLYSFLTNHLI